VPAATVVARPGVPGLIRLSASGAVPDTVAIQAGRTVTWQNGDSVKHRVVSSEPGLFDTGEISPGESATVTFTAPGDHGWLDPAYPKLSGTVRVLR
jgi:hypothetical protein